jgi:DNA-binding NarL/FixJ family response regulator
MTNSDLDSGTKPKKKAPISIVIADDHPLFRQSIKNLLESENDLKVIGEAGDGKEAIRLAAELQPDIVLMDITMPRVDGLEATRRIKATQSNIAVLVLTIHSDDQHIIGILEAGAAGYLTKSVFGEEVIQSVRAVVTGEMVLSQEVGQRLLKQAARYPIKSIPLQAGEKLSPRELEIIRLAAQGLSNKSIAADLGLNVRTVKGHLVNIFAKLNVSSRTEAVIAGLRSGFLSEDDIQLR